MVCNTLGKKEGKNSKEREELKKREKENKIK